MTQPGPHSEATAWGSGDLNCVPVTLSARSFLRVKCLPLCPPQIRYQRGPRGGERGLVSETTRGAPSPGLGAVPWDVGFLGPERDWKPPLGRLAGVRGAPCSASRLDQP